MEVQPSTLLVQFRLCRVSLFAGLHHVVGDVTLLLLTLVLLLLGLLQQLKLLGLLLLDASFTFALLELPLRPPG